MVVELWDSVRHRSRAGATNDSAVYVCAINGGEEVTTTLNTLWDTLIHTIYYVCLLTAMLGKQTSLTCRALVERVN